MSITRRSIALSANETSFRRIKGARNYHCIPAASYGREIVSLRRERRPSDAINPCLPARMPSIQRMLEQFIDMSLARGTLVSDKIRHVFSVGGLGASRGTGASCPRSCGGTELRGHRIRCRKRKRRKESGSEGISVVISRYV